MKKTTSNRRSILRWATNEKGVQHFLHWAKTVKEDMRGITLSKAQRKKDLIHWLEIDATKKHSK